MTTKTSALAALRALAASFAGRLNGPVWWIVERSPPHSPALAGVGRADRVIFVETGSDVLQTLERRSLERPVSEPSRIAA